MTAAPARDTGLSAPALPYRRAFIVEFGVSIDFEGGRVTGRLEHLKTGRRSRFASADKLMAGIERLLASADSRRGASRT